MPSKKKPAPSGGNRGRLSCNANYAAADFTAPNGHDPREPLTASDIDELAEHEVVIERGLKTFIDVGLRLGVVRDKRLYRGKYATFEDYCEHRWSFSDRRARQLIDAAGIVAALPSGTIVPPSTESQARELIGLTPQQSATVMRVAHEQTAGKITAAAIRTARRQPWTQAEITTAVDGYRIHPFIACFLPFKPDEWERLAASVGQFGLIQPIRLSPDGTTIVDGRFRYLALKWNGLDPAATTTRLRQPALQRADAATYDDTGRLVDIVTAVNCLRKSYTAGDVAMLDLAIADAEAAVQ